jgi:hypothetical protein
MLRIFKRKEEVFQRLINEPSSITCMALIFLVKYLEMPVGKSLSINKVKVIMFDFEY